MQKSYRNSKHFREDELKGENRRDLTELYYLQKIADWMPYLAYGVAACGLLLFGILIRSIAG